MSRYKEWVEDFMDGASDVVSWAAPWLIIIAGITAVLLAAALAFSIATGPPEGQTREQYLQTRTTKTFDPEHGVACYYFNGDISCVQVSEGESHVAPLESN